LILSTNSRSPKLTIPEFWKAFLPMLKFVIDSWSEIGSLMRAVTFYSGTGPLTILASPLSEVAYQMASTNSYITTSKPNTLSTLPLIEVLPVATLTPL
jgi:hypothetical protein